MIRTAEQIMAAIMAAGGDVEDRPKRRPGRPRLNRTCSFDWCGFPHQSNGYCKRHNWSFRHYGDPLATSRLCNPPEKEDAHLWPWCTRPWGVGGPKRKEA